jgi:hypothetical protein
VCTLSRSSYTCSILILHGVLLCRSCMYLGGNPRDVGTKPAGVLKRPPCANDAITGELGVNTGTIRIGVPIG